MAMWSPGTERVAAPGPGEDRGVGVIKVLFSGLFSGLYIWASLRSFHTPR